MIIYATNKNLSISNIYNEIKNDITKYHQHNGFVTFMLDGETYSFGWQLIPSKIVVSFRFCPARYSISNWDDAGTVEATKFWFKNRIFAKTCKLLTIPEYGNEWLDTYNIFSGIIAMISQIITEGSITMNPDIVAYLYTKGVCGEFDSHDSLKHFIPKHKGIHPVSYEIREAIRTNITDVIAGPIRNHFNDVERLMSEHHVNLNCDAFGIGIAYMVLAYKRMLMSNCKDFQIITDKDLAEIVNKVIVECRSEKCTFHQFDIVTKIFCAIRKKLNDSKEIKEIECHDKSGIGRKPNSQKRNQHSNRNGSSNK